MKKPKLENDAEIYWRFTDKRGAYVYGYVTILPSGLVRLGERNGDEAGGQLVDPKDIEWKELS